MSVFWYPPLAIVMLIFIWAERHRDTRAAKILAPVAAVAWVAIAIGMVFAFVRG